MVAEVCPHCTGIDTEKRLCPEESPHHAGLYCNCCDRWIKWLPKPKTRKGYAVVHIVSGIMETCDVFFNVDQASDRQAEMFKELDLPDWGNGEPFTLDEYNDSGSTLLTIEDCKVIPDEREV